MAGRADWIARTARLARAAIRFLGVAFIIGMVLVSRAESGRGGRAGPPRQGGRADDAGPGAVVADSLPSFEELHARMLKLFAEAPWAWTDIHPERNPVSVDLFPRGRDKEAWALLTEGVRRAKPGLAVSMPPVTVLQCGFDMEDGSHENRPVMYRDGMLCSPRAYFGGMIRTLKVGPEFEQGLRLLEKTVPEVVFEWPAPMQDEDPVEASKAGISREQAVRVARAFAAEIELPLGEEPQVVYKVADWPYGPRWEVRNFDFAVVAVDANDGSVVLAQNSSAREESYIVRAAETVTEGRALERATEVLRLMGAARDEVLLQRVERSAREGIARASWLAYWTRATKGIPYASDEAHVVLDGATGEVLYATKRWWGAPPEVMDATISAARAVEIARGLAEEIGVREIEGAKGEAVLKIVQPNYYYPAAAKAKRPEYQGATRIVWEVTVLIPTTMPGRNVRPAILWIDAVSGELLGGYSFRGGGPSGVAREAGAGDTPRAPTSGGAAEGEAGAFPTHLAVVGGAAVAVILGVAALGWRAMASRRKGKRAEAEGG